MNEEKGNVVISEIVSEYGRIDRKWMRLHYGTSVALVIFSFLIEWILGFVLFNSGYSSISVDKYILKYIAAPLLFNICLLFTGYCVLRSKSIKQSVKVYSISLLFVGVCFVLFTIHSMLDILYFVFAVPILLTVVYSDYLLTSVTAALGVILKVISELFLQWDPMKTYPFDSGLDMVNFFISLCVLFSFYAACMVVIRFERAKNTASIQKEIERYKMRRRLVTDELTQIYNRTALRNAFQYMEEDASSNSYIFVMMDMDNFKPLNDTLGHQKGDESLREFGSILKNNCGDAEAFRFGGDEFCLLFKNKSMEEVIAICENIQGQLRAKISIKFGQPLSVSMGIARYKKRMSASQLLKNSDSALYKAKENRGTISIYPD